MKVYHSKVVNIMHEKHEEEVSTYKKSVFET